VLYMAYNVGGLNLHAAFFKGMNPAPFNYIADYLKNPSSPNVTGWIARAIGAACLLVLSFMHSRFIWWPLHPLGFTVGMVWLVNHLWLSIFLAWFIKTLILRYGGARTYDGAKPFFYGLILGQYSAAVIWFIIDIFTGMKGNSVFWI